MVLAIVCLGFVIGSAVGLQMNMNTKFKRISSIVYSIILGTAILVMVFVPLRNDCSNMVPISTCVETKTESLSSIVIDGRIQFPSEYVAEVKYYKSEGNWYTISRTTKVITAIKRR